MPPKPEPPQERVADATPAPPQRDREFNPDRIAALLDQSQPESGGQASEQAASQGADAASNASAQMTANELDALRSRLAECWFLPNGWSDPSEVKVVVQFRLNRDGTLLGIPDIVRAPSSRYSLQATESVLRALRRCAPYDLPPEKYESWKEIRMTFDPIAMFR